MGYRKEAVKGISWIGSLSLATKVIGFLEAIILARILIPSQFGAYGVALLALGLLETITESGINTVLIQEKNIDKHISSAWIVSIARGIFIMLILLVTTPFIVEFFHAPEAISLLYLISFIPFLRGFINPAVVKLQKELKFVKNFWYKFTILIVDTVVSVIVTYITKSPVGIVVGLLSGVIVELFLSHVLITPTPRLNFEKVYIKKIFNRGKWVTASSIFDYLFYNVDNIAVGRLLGSAALGIYQLAYALVAVPLSEVGKVFVHVTVPIMIKISKDSNKLKMAYFNNIFSIAIITLPFALIFALFPTVATAILGEKWAGITAVLPILAVLGFVKSVSLSSTALFLSTNKQEYTTIITFINILGLIVSIVPLILNYGLFGAGLSALIGSLCAVPFIIYFTRKTFLDLSKNKI